MDIRVTNTQSRIASALIQAIKEEPLIVIKDKDLIKKAEIAPGTFYKYYSDHVEVLRSVEKELLDGYRQALSASSRHWLGLNHSASKKDVDHLLMTQTDELIDFFLSNAEAVTALASPNGDPAFMSTLDDMLNSVVKRIIIYYFKIYGESQRLLKAPDRTDFITHKFSTTFISSILYFLRHGDRFSKLAMKKFTIKSLVFSPYDMAQHGF